jgi:hypothetical protein
LSLSRSTVIGEPDEIMRARWPARSTSSNRFSTLSMQSSTVTRAIPNLLAGEFEGGDIRRAAPKSNAKADYAREMPALIPEWSVADAASTRGSGVDTFR